MRHKERAAWMALLENERESHRRERQELLNRIAAPEKRIVDPVEREPAPPPVDEKEFAYVGGVVPDGVSVGYLGDTDG